MFANNSTYQKYKKTEEVHCQHSSTLMSNTMDTFTFSDLSESAISTNNETSVRSSATSYTSIPSRASNAKLDTLTGTAHRDASLDYYTTYAEATSSTKPEVSEMPTDLNGPTDIMESANLYQDLTKLSNDATDAIKKAYATTSVAPVGVTAIYRAKRPAFVLKGVRMEYSFHFERARLDQDCRPPVAVDKRA